MSPAEYIVVNTILTEGHLSPHEMEARVYAQYSSEIRQAIYKLLDTGMLRHDDDLKLEVVGDLGKPNEGDVVCNHCEFFGSPDDFHVALSVYHWLRCPVCMTTDLDTSRCDIGDYGDDNSLRLPTDS